MMDEGISTQLSRLMSVPQHEHSYPSVTLQVVVKIPKINTFSGDPTGEGRGLICASGL